MPVGGGGFGGAQAVAVVGVGVVDEADAAFGAAVDGGEVAGLIVGVGGGGAFGGGVPGPLAVFVVGVAVFGLDLAVGVVGEGDGPDFGGLAGVVVFPFVAAAGFEEAVLFVVGVGVVFFAGEALFGGGGDLPVVVAGVGDGVLFGGADLRFGHLVRIVVGVGIFAFGAGGEGGGGEVGVLVVGEGRGVFGEVCHFL